MSQKKLPKINRDTGKGATGYQWDNGNIAFGDPRDITRRKDFLRDYDKAFREKTKSAKKAA
jgi:hypothetical protein